MKPAGTPMSGRRFSGLWLRFRDERDGVAAIEFAMVLPVMLAAYVGMVNLAQMVMTNRKTTQLALALSDLTSRVQTVSPTDVSDIFKASETILLPYDSSKASMIVASVVIDANRKARICWASSYPDAKAAPARGAEVPVPDSIRIANTSVIMAQASYTFTPLIGDAIFAMLGGQPIFEGVTLGNNPIYTRPRNGKVDGNANIEQIVRTDVKGCPLFTP